MTDADMTEDDLEVLAANQRFYDAFADSDLRRMEELWARESLVTCIHPGWNALIGRDPVMASWRAILTSGQTPIQSSSARAVVMGETAYVICLEGGRDEPPILVATNVFARERGEWKLVHHHAGQLSRSAGPPTARPLN